MKFDSPILGLYATLGVVLAVTVLLAGLLARPSHALSPDRTPRGMDLDEPPNSGTR
jgi:hypothetical protein